MYYGVTASRTGYKKEYRENDDWGGRKPPQSSFSRIFNFWRNKNYLPVTEYWHYPLITASPYNLRWTTLKARTCS